MVVSRDVYFMKDTFTSGKHEYTRSKTVAVLTQVKRPMVKTTSTMTCGEVA